MPVTPLPTGVSVYWQEVGDGEPLLLIMGTGADHSVWDDTAAVLAARYRVITYDQRGTGRSDTPPDPESYSMRILADDAAALLDAIGIERAHVAGLSLGSTTAQELALNHPQRVASLQLHCTWGRTDEWLRRVFLDMAYTAERDDLEAFVRTASMWVVSPAALEEKPDEVAAFERAYLLENEHPPTREGLLGHLHADMKHDALDRLPGLSVPTLVTSGEVDWQVPTRYGRAVHERIRASTLHVFTGPYSSHTAFSEMPDEWNALVLGFLAEQSL